MATHFAATKLPARKDVCATEKVSHCLTDLPVLQVNWQKGIEDTVRREGEGLYFHEKKKLIKKVVYQA